MATTVDLRLASEAERLHERNEPRQASPERAGESPLRDALRDAERVQKRLTQDAFEVPLRAAALALRESKERGVLAHPSLTHAPQTSVVSLDPVKYLGNVEAADVVIRVPGIPGKYGHAIADFEVKPGTEMIVRAKVRNGVVVPGETLISFNPPLHNRPLGIPTWIRTEAVALHDNGDGTSAIKLDLSGFPNWNVTRKLLDVRAIPNALAQLVTLLQNDGAKAEVNEQRFVGGQPFNYRAFNIELADVELKEGAIALGTDQAQLVLGRNSRVAVTGTADGLRIEGHMRLRSFTASGNDSQLTVGQSHAHAVIHTTLDHNTLEPTKVKIELHTLAGTFGISDGHGKHVFVSGATGPGGKISFTSDLSAAANANLAVDLSDAKLKLHRAQLSFDDGGGNPTEVHVGEGELVGKVKLENNVLYATVTGAKLTAETKNVTFGTGALALSSTHASLAVENGHVRLDEHGAHFAGAIRVDGKIGAGQIGRKGGPLSLALADGSKLSLALSQASIGKRANDFKGSGTFFAHLAAGDVQLEGGTRIGLKEGTLAQVTATDLASDDTGQRAGRLDIKTYARPTLAPDALTASLGRALHVDGAELGAHLILDEVALRSDGSLSVGRERTRLHGAFAKVQTTLAPQAVFASGKVPALKAVLSEISDAHVRFDLPIPARKLGSGPLRVFEIAPGTVAHFTMPVVDGRIDRSHVELTFVPPIKGPGLIKDHGIRSDHDGNFIMKLDWFPDINLSKLLFGKVTMPATLGELPALGESIESFLQKTVGRVRPLGNPMADPLAELNRAGATLAISNVSMKPHSHTLGGEASLTPTQSKFSLSVRDGVARIVGESTGKVSFKLSAGTVDLGDGTTLDLAAGANASMSFDKVSWRSGAAPEVHGTMQFTAKLSGRLPEGGLKLSDKVTLTALGTHDGTVQVTVREVTLDRTGKLDLAQVELELTSDQRLRNGLVFLKPTTAAQPAL